ncbi:SMC-Scp complex subunit ScpB [Caldiplasma sukawensis]
MDEVEKKVEAILFASGYLMQVNEIASICGEDSEDVGKAIKKLTKEYAKRDTSIEIKKVGKKYRMELKDEYKNIAMQVARPEIDHDGLKLLSVINSGIDTVGRVKDAVGKNFELALMKVREMGFIKLEKYRNTEKIILTRKFYSYFNIQPPKQPKMEKGGEDEQ